MNIGKIIDGWRRTKLLYTTYLLKTIDDLQSFVSLYRVYAPQDLKSRGDDITNRIIRLLKAEIERAENDDRPDPF